MKLFRASLLVLAAWLGPWGVMPVSMAEAPIELEADEMEFDSKEGKSTYRGNAVIVRGGMRLSGDVIEVFSEGGEIVRVVAHAEPAAFSRRSDKPEESLHAEARTIEYHVKEKRVKLTGRVQLSSGRRSLRGHYVVYMLETGKTFADGGQGGRVRLIVDPDQTPPRAEE